MRLDPDEFGEEELALLYVAKKLNESLRVEDVLNNAGLDYAVEPDTYRGGVIFQSERVGAFFYVTGATEAAAREALSRAGFKPYQP